MTLGSNVTNYGVTTPKVTSKVTDTETLLLDTQIATGITHDYEEKSPKKLISAFALRTSNNAYDQKFLVFKTVSIILYLVLYYQKLLQILNL